MDVWMLFVFGVIGGLLHWIMPYGKEESALGTLAELFKRIIASVVAVFIVYYAGEPVLSLANLSAATSFGAVGYIFVGYFGLDILKAIRDKISS